LSQPIQNQYDFDALNPVSEKTVIRTFNAECIA
jgi:hypothetical protein